MTANKIYLFTDGSVNTKLNFGFGAYLAVKDTEILTKNQEQSVKVKRFENTSSTKLELQTLIWALSEVSGFQTPIVLYTDSQNIIGLPRRRERLEKDNYRSKAGIQITNSELYKHFFQLLDELDFEMQKIEGHKRTHQKDYIDRLFTIVDRASRDALRKWNGNLEWDY